MIHIVSGFMRSGTSMMMQALIAGGMSAAWSPDRDRLADAHADDSYRPNPGGLYEVAIREYRAVDFPLRYQGKLIKVMAWGLDHLAYNPEGYRIIVMLRHPEEIRQSYNAAFQSDRAHLQSLPFLDEYEARMDRAVKTLFNRKDVAQVVRVRFGAVVEQPLACFSGLASEGWPIDAAGAAAIVRPELYRFRLESLTAGI